MLKKITSLAIFVTFGLSSSALAQYKYISINGQVLSPQQVFELERQAGMSLPPGHYSIDFQTGCVAHRESASLSCPDSGDYQVTPAGGAVNNYRDGSSSYYHQDWGSFGSDGNGCYYTEGWSNC